MNDLKMTKNKAAYRKHLTNVLGQPAMGALCLAASVANGQWFGQPCYQQKPYLCQLASQKDTCPSKHMSHSSSSNQCTGCECRGRFPSPAQGKPLPPLQPKCSPGFKYHSQTDMCYAVSIRVIATTHENFYEVV